MKKIINNHQTSITKGTIKSILILIVMSFSYFMNAQSKYKFYRTGISSFASNMTFTGISKDRETIIEWDKDIWLSSKNYGIDSISGDGMIKIYDTNKGKKHFLEIKPLGDKLSYNYTENRVKVKSFSVKENEWYKSLCEDIIYPYLKAVFYNRFFRNNNELVTVRVGSKFPYFDKVDINNKRITSGDIKNKITIINFWNIYCGPCIKEMPDLNKIVKKYSDSDTHKFIAFVSSTKEQITNLFAKRKEVRFDYLQIPNSRDIQDMLGIRFNPVSFILDEEGTVIYMKTGFSSENISNMEKVLEELNNKKLAKK